jgi:hypothetical protein
LINPNLAVIFVLKGFHPTNSVNHQLAEAEKKDPDDSGFFYFTMTPAPKFAGLRYSPIQQVYQ